MSTPSLLNIPYLYKAGTLYSQIPESGAGDFTVTRTTTPTAGRSTRVNKDGFIETVLDNVPRLDYPLGGAVNGCPALLVEPAATNGIRNNSMVGASAPNTLPNNWSNAGSNLTRQSVATGTLNGIPYVDIRISGTANNAFHDVFWDASNVIAALVGQDWVASCYLQIIAQPNPPVNYLLAMREFNSSGGFLGVFQGAALSISTTSFNRFSFTRVLNQAAVAFVHPSLFFTLVNGQYYDFTIRIGYPQMERGTVATSVIPTTTAAVTRSADVIRNTAATALIGQTEGTIYFEYYHNTATNAGIRNAFNLEGNVASSFNGINFATSNNGNDLQVAVQVSSSSVVSGGAFSTSVSEGWHKVAFGYNAATNGTSFYFDGNLIATRTLTSIPAMSRIAVMARANPFSGFDLDRQFNNRIRNWEIYPNRIPNTAAPGVLSLATLTAL